MFCTLFVPHRNEVQKFGIKLIYIATFCNIVLCALRSVGMDLLADDSWPT
jgi:hypothetical protein